MTSSTRKSKSSILDKFQETMNPKLWLSVDGKPILNPDFRDQVKRAVEPFTKKYGFTEKGILFYGGNAGYQYNAGSDADFSVYIDWPKDQEINYGNLADELYDAGFDYEGIECHLFLKPPAEVELVEANENVYNVSEDKWILEPEKHDFDPGDEFADMIVKAELLRQKMQYKFDSIIDEIKEMQELGIDAAPADILKSFDSLIKAVATLRNNRGIEHTKLREKAVKKEKISVLDRATENEIAWKTISETPMLKKLDKIKRSLKV